MTAEVSIFLDLVRILAAGTVFLAHASWHDHTGGLFWQLQNTGQEAVDVFFVLSGFVISHVATTREHDWKEYALARASRVASVALPALLLAFVLDAIGSRLRPELYRGFCCDSAPLAWQYLRNLTMTGDLWSQHVAPGSDIPYWSLGFEAWYYLAFGLFLFLPARFRWIGAAAAMLAAGPGIAVLFPLWLLGGACRRLVAARRLPRRLAWVLLLGLPGVFVVATLSVRAGQMYDAFALDRARLGDYAQDYLVGLLFAAGLVGFASQPGTCAALLARLERPVRWLAGATFALYLFHLPLMRFLVAASPWDASAWATRAAVLLGVPLLVLALAEATERRKRWWRRAIVSLASRRRAAAG